MVEAKRRAGVFLKETGMSVPWRTFGNELEGQIELLCESARTLTCLGMAVAMRCEPCIEYWLDECIAQDIDAAKVRDVLRLAVKMGGGPGMMYAAKAHEMYEEMLHGRNTE
jgi:alkylhydroperoxidase/carboxymuconolactone decarboxylase family protein YurZ